MRFTNILLWVQENKISEKFYKKLGFEVLVSTDAYSEIQLGEFSITLVNMRDEDEFNGDSLSGIKGKGMYIYIKVDDVAFPCFRRIRHSKNISGLSPIYRTFLVFSSVSC